MHRDCFTTNSLICRPPKNATPTEKQIGYCRPNIIKAIEEHKPEVIILAGTAAVRSVIGWLWKEEVGSIGRWIGWTIPVQRLNAWVCPIWHPSFLVRSIDETHKEIDDVKELIYRRHLQQIADLSGVPWENGAPDYRRMVERVTPSEAAKIIDKMIRKGGMVAFDYETNARKPEVKGARIVSAAVCWQGYKTIAFPWYGEVIGAMKRLLQSPLRKIASNLKFEERWTLAEFGEGVKNWAFDTMLAAHVDDCRKEITGLKFQSFVTLGVESYDDRVKPYMKERKEGGLNRIEELNTTDLLLYNGLDALLEYHVALKQAERMHYPLEDE